MLRQGRDALGLSRERRPPPRNLGFKPRRAARTVGFRNLARRNHRLDSRLIIRGIATVAPDRDLPERSGGDFEARDAPLQSPIDRHDAALSGGGSKMPQGARHNAVQKLPPASRRPMATSRPSSYATP